MLSRHSHQFPAYPPNQSSTVRDATQCRPLLHLPPNPHSPPCLTPHSLTHSLTHPPHYCPDAAPCLPRSSLNVSAHVTCRVVAAAPPAEWGRRPRQGMLKHKESQRPTSRSGEASARLGGRWVGVSVCALCEGGLEEVEKGSKQEKEREREKGRQNVRFVVHDIV